MQNQPTFQVEHLPRLNGVPCPCGTARRAFADLPWFNATVHLTSISRQAKVHYHKRLTETYVVQQCDAGAYMELDDQSVPVAPGSAVLIPPGVRHRAVGEMEVIIFCTPKFDPDDEWFD